ncbi:hypothetical protein PanWU01x14_277240 [Parasponia andersonii]|uniref:Uncharacterized protein n=1 Tax=Parasponia andersonii TaxID=3476 RepID=A0A2P5B2P6_PARAD|nr:hypothetical protein PanWU01x14_277240 [Parasponia andersonii]
MLVADWGKLRSQKAPDQASTSSNLLMSFLKKLEAKSVILCSWPRRVISSFCKQSFSHSLLSFKTGLISKEVSASELSLLNSNQVFCFF